MMSSCPPPRTTSAYLGLRQDRLPASLRSAAIRATPRQRLRLVGSPYQKHPLLPDLVIDPAAIAGQWAGRGPARTVEAIRAGRGLTRIDEAGVWTLYRIGSP